MDMDIPRAPKVVSETKRDRDVFRLYGPAFRNIPHLDHTSALGQHVPIAAKDSALVAFAQLAAIRMGATRALISLIDMERQHILAEATATTSLRSGIRNDLWLGNVSLPREVLVCEQVLGINPERITSSEQASVVFNDLAEHADYKERNYVKDNIVRFYAGVALTSPRGAIVGALCIIDSRPLPGLPRQDVLYLHDLAATIMEHLDTYTLKDQHMRGEQLTRGLISFAEGASALQAYSSEDHQPPLTLQPYISPPADAAFHPYNVLQDHHVLPLQPADGHAALSPPEFPMPPSESTAPGRPGPVPMAVAVPPPRSDTSDSSSVRALQESILPANSKSMFARAANIMRASSDLDGVLILDASIAATTAHQKHTGDVSESSAYDSLPSEGESVSGFPGMTHSPTSQQSSEGNGQRCQILGFSTRDTSSVAENIWALRNRSLMEADLRRMLSLYPMGNIIHFTADGEPISSTDSESSTSTITPLDGRPESKQRSRRGQSRSNKTLNAIQLTLPGARSVAFVPFWDFERSRWFAGCLCWTNEPDRLLSPQLDLLFFKVFGHSVMNELSRLDTIASDQVKTTFVSLISHELRSPLHGILGSIQFMQDSPLDSFQVTMLNSMAACGQTLLDTIDHILDYSKVNETNQNVSSKKLKGTKTICLSSKPLKSLRASIPAQQYPAVDLGLATEEVVEAVYAGLSYRAISNAPDDDGAMSPYNSRVGDDEELFPTIPLKRKSCFIVLDLEDQDWNFCLPIGAWRRILMNIFGNALKFTESGHIKVSLHANQSRSTDGFTHITVSIVDTGMGMSPDFLANKVFQPFSQENPHSSGTGLGLSIVRQIIEKIGGKVDVTSNLRKGTHVVVKLALPRLDTPQLEAPQRTPFLAALPRVKGRKICILHQIRPQAPGELDTHTALELFSDTLGKTLKDFLHMEVVHTTDWEGHDADLVICPEPSFHYLATVRAQQNAVTRAPVVIFVATDGLEAATLRSDARILSKKSVVEIITQPCGPYKLANILSHCLNRVETSGESSSFQPSPAYSIPSPRPNLESTATAVYMEPAYHFPPAHIELPKTPSSESIEFLPDAITPPPGLTAALIEQSNPITKVHSMTSPPDMRADSSYVLITDDNPINRRLLVAFMNKRKLRYQEAENGLEALNAYQEGRVRFDVILMDISMPVMDGMTATRLIRDHESRHKIKPTHIIALTGLVSASARLEAWSSGVDCYLTKPVDFRKLEKILHGNKEGAGRNEG